mmetsp:Transcript_30938/g.90150  ORF Transcript_30938/g.90150 Transcript_30938/m.90150 type:complete len:233 (-) Transcript_30938:1369-2067(-)
MAFRSSNIHRYPSLPRSSSRTPSRTKSTFRTASQRLSNSPGAAFCFSSARRSFWKASNASASSFRPLFFAAATAGQALSTAAKTSFASAFFWASSRTSCRRSAKASSAAAHAALSPAGDERSPSMPSIPRVPSTSFAAAAMGSKDASGSASRATLHSDTSLDKDSMTFGVLKLSKIAAWTASLQAAVDASIFFSSSPGGFWPWGWRLQKSRLPRKCFILRSSALAMSMAWSE